MKENKYDDPGFFSRYSQMKRSLEGLAGAGEWVSFRPLFPDLRGKRVLDLGCGFGWHCRYAREQGAISVMGIDLSEKMLERARELTQDPAIIYQRIAIEDIAFEPGTFDVVISSLAFHYIENFQAICRAIHHCLTPGGSLVFSVEHPVFTALPAQDWYYDALGRRLHWPLDRYQEEGVRHTRFLDTDVIKYHRTLATWLNTLMATGFTINRIGEPTPTDEALALYPEMKDETRRPIFLLIAADR